jgi:hypothetical protein
MLLLKLCICFVRRNFEYLFLIDGGLEFLKHKRKSSDLQLPRYKQVLSLSGIGNWD